MKSEIILIGPIGSGKTTVAELLYMRTMLPHRSMDLLRWKYFDEIGYDREFARERYIEDGLWGMYRYWKPFEAYAAKRMMEDFRECIYDFGASQTVYEDGELFKQVSDLFAPFPHVILLLPSPDPDESIQILNSRNTYDTDTQRQINEHFVLHHSNYDLAKYTSYTKGKSPDETCEDILKRVRGNGWMYEP